MAGPVRSGYGRGMQSRRVRTDLLDLAYEQLGPDDGLPVILLHGFPYDPRCFDDVAPALAADGCRVLVPYLRGYGPTRFLSERTPRSGEQAALGHDLLQFMDGLKIPRATLMGYDWGGRAACIVAALWPERVLGLVSCTGYNIQNIATSAKPGPAAQEHRLWYQYYFHTPRGAAGLTENRRGICKLLWTLWSPHWAFDDATFERSAASFDNPDFVAVVIQSYRHRYGYAPGDPAMATIESRLAAQPAITVPTINLHGDADGVGPASERDGNAAKFTGSYERRMLARVGHNVPQEAPAATVAAIRDLVKRYSSVSSSRVQR
jgi:pimeloyl-ACP methyl ester carboxylesterase